MNASETIDKYIANLRDWRGEKLSYIRKVIHDTDPEIIEEWKWMGSPCFSHHGLVIVANAHKDKIKLTFSNGAKILDPDKVFNNGLNGNKWRAIDIYENDKINENFLKALIKSAINFNLVKKTRNN